ncbi:MAG: hypothetical protein WDZ94_00380 [Patescibacteria group bacterium]
MFKYLLALLLPILLLFSNSNLGLAQETAQQATTPAQESEQESPEQEDTELSDDEADGDLEDGDAESAVGIDVIQTRPRQTAEILRLRDLYRDQVERYRTVDREFQISKAQYQQIQTLQSLEEAVVSTREVLLVRDQVLITYFELMLTSLEDTEGIDLVDKRAVINEMIEHIEVLREHRDAVAQTTNREGIAERVEEFALLSEPFETTAYKGLALINIGDIQTVYDKARLIYADILTYHQEQPVSAVKQQERLRAYREAERELERIGLLLREIRIEYGRNTTIGRDSYDRVLGNNLNSAYSGTSQIIFYLRELFLELT